MASATTPAKRTPTGVECLTPVTDDSPAERRSGSSPSASRGSCGTSPTRSSSSPPTSRAPREDVSDPVQARSAGELAGADIAATRGRRSSLCPGANMELAAKLITRRCLVEQLQFDGPEVFDLAAGEQKPLSRSQSVDPRRQLLVPPGRSVSSALQSPVRPQCRASDETWNLDWAAVMSLPGSDVHGEIDEHLLELRKAFEPMMQRSVDQMTSWVATELAFVRQSLGDEMQALKEHHAKETSALQATCTELREAISALQSAAPSEKQNEDKHQLSETWTSEMKDLRDLVQEHGDRLDCLSRDVCDLRTNTKESGEELERLSRELAIVDAAAKDHDTRIDNVSEELKAMEPLRRKLGEKADRDEVAEALGNESARIADIFKKKLEAMRIDLAADIAARARLDHVDKSLEAHTAWEQRFSGWVDSRLEELGVASEESGQAVQRHDDWMQQMSSWLEQVRKREQGLVRVVTLLAEDSSPTLLNLCQTTFGLN